MNRPLKRRASVKLLIIGIVCTTMFMSPWPQAKGAVNPAQVRENENKILADLVVLKMQLQFARSEIQTLEEKLQENLREKDLQKRELEKIRGDLKASSKELGKWVEFTYRHGSVSILEVMISSADFNDFINRSFLIWNIMEQQTRAFQLNRRLREQVGEAVDKLDDVNDSINHSRSRLNETIAEMRRKETKLEHTLAELRKQSARLEAQLDTLSQNWASVTGLTTDIIHRLSSLSTEELPPDGIKFTLGGMRLEYRTSTINRAISQVTPDPAARVKVNIEPEQIIISGNTGTQNIDFSARGNFEVSPDRKKIIFVPDSVTVNGDTLEDYMLDSILDNSDLTWDITRYYPKLKVTGVSSGSGKITCQLRY